MQPTSTKSAMYAAEPTAVASDGAPRSPRCRPATAGERHGGHEGDEGDRAARRASARARSCAHGDRREPGEVERAGADLGAQHGVADHEAADRDQQREEADVGDVREDVARGRVGREREQAEERRRRRRAAASVHHRFGGDRDPQRVTEGEPWRALTSSTSSRNRLSSESSSGRTSAGGRRAIAASCGAARSPRRAPGRSRSRGRRASTSTPPTDVERRAARPRAARASVGADEHVPRPVVHRVADRAVAAGGGEPAVDEHDRRGRPAARPRSARAS